MARLPGLVIHLLGDFRVLVRGHAVEDARWSRPQATPLVKLLALDPRHQLHRQQLIDAIWPDLDPESGAANLHKIIHLARHALEPKLTSGANSQFIVTSRQQVQLRSPGALWVDVEEFEQLANRAIQSGIASDYEEAPHWCSGGGHHIQRRGERLAGLDGNRGGQGVRREVESEGPAEKFRAGIDGSHPDDCPAKDSRAAPERPRFTER